MSAESSAPANVPVYVLAGPSGVGKGTVIARILDSHPNVRLSVSATTRAPRPGEIDGVNYHYLSEQQFADLVDEDGMLEWAVVFGTTSYGTQRRPIEEWVAEGHPVILEIDVQGARQVRQSMPEATLIFLAPPSWDELVARLQGRDTETPEQLERRLATAKEELDAQSEFDYVVINDEVERTVKELVALMGL